jgi:6,7-dimethyl-8-ribityllumazine synthase
LFPPHLLATTRLNKEFISMAKKKKSGVAKSKAGAKTVAKKSDTIRILIVEARYYDHIADALLSGATLALDQADAIYDRITVPGALEIPAAIAMAIDAAKRNPYDGVVALGCVIQGETYHFEIVADQSARALIDLAVARALPVGNGILTVDTEAQARARSNSDERNKGRVAALAALAMVRLKRSLEN